MKTKIKKTIIFMFSVLLMIQWSPLTIFAETYEKPYYYTNESGETLEYYVDNNGEEYIYSNGEKMYVLLPLEKYLITDEDVINAELERMKNTVDASTFSLNSEARGTVIVKTIFNNTINFGDSVFRIGYHTWDDGASHIRLKTSKHKPGLSNHNLNVIFYWYLEEDNRLYGKTYMDQNCSITKGYSLGSTGIEKVDVGVTPVGGMTSCKLAVTLTVG